jgi:mannose-6-phosphate isomerase-like protein (cupin superfamily)
MHMREKIVTVNEGEFLIMPRGVEHKPVANEEVEIMLFEPATTLNTGNIVDSDLTRENLEKI